jgi:hypothetical protein
MSAKYLILLLVLPYALWGQTSPTSPVLTSFRELRELSPEGAALKPKCGNKSSMELIQLTL